jgi:hypothetical protein
MEKNSLPNDMIVLINKQLSSIKEIQLVDLESVNMLIRKLKEVEKFCDDLIRSQYIRRLFEDPKLYIVPNHENIHLSKQYTYNHDKIVELKLKYLYYDKERKNLTYKNESIIRNKLRSRYNNTNNPEFKQRLNRYTGWTSTLKRNFTNSGLKPKNLIDTEETLRELDDMRVNSKYSNIPEFLIETINKELNKQINIHNIIKERKYT